PSVRALPLGTHAVTQSESREKRDRSSYSGLLLINKKPSYAAVDCSNPRPSGPETIEHADSDASTKSATATNAWTARIRPRANTTECASAAVVSEPADPEPEPEPEPVPESVPLSEPLPLSEPQTANVSQQWDDMLDSGIEFADSVEPDDRHQTSSQPEPVPQRDALIVPDIDTAAQDHLALTSEPAANPDSAVPETEPNISSRVEVEEVFAQPAPVAPKAAEIWGKPQKEPSTPIQPTQTQSSRWWKASLSGGSASRSSPAPSSPAPCPTPSSDGQARRHTSLRLSNMQKPESGTPNKQRSAKPSSESADAKGKRTFGRRQTAPIPTVVPPVLLSKAMTRSKEHMSVSATGPMARPNERPLSALCEGILNTAAADIETVHDTKHELGVERLISGPPTPSLAAVVESNTGSNDLALAPLNRDNVLAKPNGDAKNRSESKPSLTETVSIVPTLSAAAGPRTPAAQRKPGGSSGKNSSSANGATHADNWRAGTRPKLQQQAPTQTLPQEQVDSASTWRRNTSSTKNIANRLSLSEKLDRTGSKPLSANSWRAVPGSLKLNTGQDVAIAVNAAAAAAVSKVKPLSSTKSAARLPPLSIVEPQFVPEKPSSARSDTVSDDAQDTARLLRVDRQRSQTQSVGSSLTKSNHNFYYGAVGSGLRNAPDADQNQLGDLLQIKPPVSSTSSATTHSSSKAATAPTNIKNDSSGNNTDGTGIASSSDAASMPPLLPHKILADILGGDEVPARSSARSSNSTSANATHMVKPIGGGSIKTTSAGKTSVDPTGSSRQEREDILGRNKLGYSTSSLFQINEGSLLTSAYSVAGRPVLEGASSVDESPFSWQKQQQQQQQQQQHQHQQANTGHHDSQTRYDYIHQQSGLMASATAPQPSAPHGQSHTNTTTPSYNSFSSTSVDQQWMYSHAMPPPAQATYHHQSYAEGAPVFASSSGPPGPAFSTFASRTAMIWSDSNQALTDPHPGMQPFRNATDSSRDPSRGDGANQRSYKSSDKQPRPIGTRSTLAGGQNSMRSHQENGAPQQQDHRAFGQLQLQQQQQQPQQQFLAPHHSQHMHLQSWLPQYPGVQQQIYMHGPAAGYSVASPHQSPQVAAIPTTGSSVISPYVVPHHHMMDMSGSHPHFMVMQAPVSEGMNGVHASSANSKGVVVDNEHLPSPSPFVGATSFHYMPKPSQQPSSQHYAYAYPAGPTSGGQQHQQQLGFMQYAPPLYPEPSQIAYSPMYIGQSGGTHGSSVAPNYYVQNELQQVPVAFHQQQQQQQQSSLSLSATPFQPNSLSKQQQQQDYQPSRQRGRSRGLELIEQSDRAQAMAKMNDTEESTCETDLQTENSQGNVSTPAAVSKSANDRALSDGLQNEKTDKISNGSSNGSQNASTREGRDQRGTRSHDRRNSKQPTKTVAEVTPVPPQSATNADSAMQQKGGESKRRQKQDRSRKPAKPAAPAANDLLPNSAIPATSIETNTARSGEKLQKNVRGGNRSSRGPRRSQAPAPKT
ncbi:hypothetical protein H4R99_007465, partial [Coemansia sp. RSA 1722]